MTVETPADLTARRPAIDADFLNYRDLLCTADSVRLDAATRYFDSVLRPVVPAHWNDATFPFEVLPSLGEQELVRLSSEPGRSLLHGLMHLELARVDVSMSTFLGVHSVLFTDAIRAFGSDEQRDRLLPDLIALKSVGAFALTEPDHGSDISRNMQTTATRFGDEWILNGTKRWIGNGTHADYVLVWARDTSGGEILGFVVPQGTPGFTTTAIPNKIGLRIVQNADITLKDVVVPDSGRLSGARAFRDLNGLLTRSRVWVAWQTVGLQFAAFDHALAYSMQRSQFGTKIAAKQLVQEKLVRILENATASLGTLVRLAQLQDEGRVRPEHAAFAKASSSARMRESVALARGVLGGNGISTDFDMARTFADAEAVYSYEGSYEINTLVVGRAITGLSAF